MNKTIIEQPKSVNGAIDGLINKMYISNVQNRLRQLNEPTENDSKRWIWELIQNAKDSIAHDPKRENVDMKIIVNNKTVIIMHNGSPFTAKAQFGLLYKYSADKANSSESTGRFGTGFLTTHTLSKTVSIESSVFMDDTNSSLCGFSATMYRDGIDENELLEGVENMKKSIIYTQETNEWTSFTYHLKTPQNEKSLQLGLVNFIDNIAQTMLFCKELNSIELDENGTKTSIIRKPYNKLTDNIYLTEFVIDSKEKYSRKFIHTSLKESNESLSERFKTERNIRLTMAIEVDDKNNIIENIDSPSHFCVLPLVGSEKHILPVYLNSPDFEPDSERESLILTGDDILADKGVISEGGINRLILQKSVGLFKTITEYLCNSEYNKLFLLAKGLKKTPNFEKNFNKNWFEQKIILPYREVIENNAVVETIDINKKLFREDGTPNIIIPKDSKEETQSRIYDLTQCIFPDLIPRKGHTANYWADLAWKECGLFRISSLCEFVSNKESIDKLVIIGQDKFEWLNNFLQLIITEDDSLLEKYNLIPNTNGDFVLLSEEFTEGIELTNHMIDCLKDMGNDIKPFLLHKEIKVLSVPLKEDIKSISIKINDQASDILKEEIDDEFKISKLKPLLRIIPSDSSKYDSDFITKQREINSYIKILFPEIEIDSIENNDIAQNAWRNTHNWLIYILLNKIASCEKIDLLPSIIEDKVKFINEFIVFISQYLKEGDLDKFKIIPNQNGDFCSKSFLNKEVDIPLELKSHTAENFGILLKKDLIHAGIKSINITSEININSVVQIIEKLYKENTFNESVNNIDLAVYLLHLLPKESSQLLHNSQKKLLEIVKKFYYDKIYSVSQIECANENLWSSSISILLSDLSKRIEEEVNTENLRIHLSNSGINYDFGDCIIFLNDIYDYYKSINKIIEGKIIPNQNGVFCSFDDEFYKDNDIPKPLKDILKLIDNENDFRNILAESSLSESALPKHHKEKGDITKIIDDKINSLYASSHNWENENFIEAINMLMIQWFPKNRERANDYFPKIYKKKETIEMNVLWSVEDRKRMQKARSISPLLLDSFIDKAIEIDSLQKQKEKLEAEIVKLQTINVTTNLNEIVSEFPKLTAEKIRELLKLEERVKGWSGTSDYTPNSSEEKRNYINGYKGEAYIYKQLKKSNIFNDIKWEHKSVEKTELSIIDFEGESHFIKENHSKYDLTAISSNGKKIYFEVKATRTTLLDADTIALPISHREWNFVNEIKNNEIYCLARVFEVENNPTGHYLTMEGIEVSNITLE